MAEARVIQVAVPRPLHAVYDYAVPGDLALPAVGSRVRVPFGRSRTVGICVSNRVERPHAQLKSIEAVLDTEPVLTPQLMSLAHWMTGYYHHPLGEVLATILPAAARRGAACRIDEEDCWATAIDHFDNKRARSQAALFEYIAQYGPCSGDAIVAAGHRRETLRKLHKSGAVARTTMPPHQPDEAPPPPTAAQRKAIDRICHDLQGFHAYLLEGVTGSGKTEVYLRTIAPVVEQGGQVLVLVPEIALTPQTLARFQRRFARVGMLHSNLTDHERLQTWLKAAAGHLDIIIGTRSAVFTPMTRLGLIVVDEEHDSSYKQQDGLRYSARDLAIKRAQAEDIPIVLGSATPSLESLYNAQRGRYATLPLPHRAGGASMPSYHLIDMRGQTHQDGISNPLAHVMRRHLERNGQILVFLNRRGFAPSLICTSCGWVAHCSDCDARLTLHRKPEQLVCHHCTLRFPLPDCCDACQSPALLPIGLGTQRTEEGLHRMFPNVPVLRIDRDTTRTTRQLEQRFSQINAGGACIMVGTQMLAKGHHFPGVTLVAVLNADAGFCSPDFRAPERTAQLIVQVAGRAGREERPGEVWIQTYQPDGTALQQLITQGYAGFAAAELTARAAAGMPPVKPMALLRAESPDPRAAMGLLEHFKVQLQGVSLNGPVPAPLGRVANRSRFQLMVLAQSRQLLHTALSRLDPPKLPHTLRWSIDVDPYDTL